MPTLWPDLDPPRTGLRVALARAEAILIGVLLAAGLACGIVAEFKGW
jgi:hypothetical protein